MVLAIHRKTNHLKVSKKRHFPDFCQLILGMIVMIKEGRPRGLVPKDMESVAFVISLSL